MSKKEFDNEALHRRDSKRKKKKRKLQQIDNIRSIIGVEQPKG